MRNQDGLVRLQYAPAIAVPWYDRPLPWKLICWCLGLAALAAIGIALHEPVARRWRILKLEQACGTFAPAPQAVVYSDFTRSLNTPRWTRTPMDVYLRTAPAPLFWPAYSNAVYGHWLRSASGMKRLVIITVSGWNDASCLSGPTRGGCVVNVILMPPSTFGRLRESEGRSYRLQTEAPINASAIELRNVRTRESEPDRVAFDFATRDTSGTIKAVLHDDGSVTFVQRANDTACDWRATQDYPRSSAGHAVSVPVLYEATTASAQ
jgi:hypothetical protein